MAHVETDDEGVPYLLYPYDFYRVEDWAREQKLEPLDQYLVPKQCKSTSFKPAGTINLSGDYPLDANCIVLLPEKVQRVMGVFAKEMVPTMRFVRPSNFDLATKVATTPRETDNDSDIQTYPTYYVRALNGSVIPKKATTATTTATIPMNHIARQLLPPSCF